MPELDAEALAIIEKVRKLLALAGNNDNEHQAAAASAKAMELLAAYNLDMAVVTTASGPAQRQDKKTRGGLYAWQRQIWEASARLNFCLYWSIRGTAKGSTYEHRVLGRKENVISAELLAEYLQSTVERLAQTWAKEHSYHSVFVREAIAYREGMSDRLVQRLNQLRQDRLNEDRRKQEAARTSAGSGSGTALVLASVIQTETDLNTDFLYNLEPGTTARRRAEGDARRVAAYAKFQEEMEAQKRFEDANPHIRLEREKREVAERRRQERNEKRRSYSYRERQPTDRERRASTSHYYSGYDRGADVGLDRQVKTSPSKRIEND